MGRLIARFISGLHVLSERSYRKSMSNKRSKYVSLSLKIKYEIACKLSQENVNVSRLAKDLNITRITLNTLSKQKEKIISEFEAGRNAEMKRKR